MDSAEDLCSPLSQPQPAAGSVLAEQACWVALPLPGGTCGVRVCTPSAVACMPCMPRQVTFRQHIGEVLLRAVLALLAHVLDSKEVQASVACQESDLVVVKQGMLCLACRRRLPPCSSGSSLARGSCILVAMALQSEMLCVRSLHDHGDLPVWLPIFGCLCKSEAVRLYGTLWLGCAHACLAWVDRMCFSSDARQARAWRLCRASIRHVLLAVLATLLPQNKSWHVFTGR